ncbi:conserved hypothetical protein [Verrucomicrobia bacterium]|nr:conserved hypothetical protein [Verrucomicrobiota bacterium]
MSAATCFLPPTLSSGCPESAVKGAPNGLRSARHEDYGFGSTPRQGRGRLVRAVSALSISLTAAIQACRRPCAFAPGLIGLCTLCSLLAVLAACADSPTNSVAEFRAAAVANFETAQSRFRSEPTNTEAAWQFARSCFDLADVATNDVERASVAQEGIRISEAALASASNSAALHYYLGMNLAQLARTKGLGALKILHQMQQQFGLVLELDERFDFAGANRNLGLIYRDAPSIISIGDRQQSQRHLERAVELASKYPENRLNLIEAYLKWGDRGAARRQLEELDKLWPSAHQEFVGAPWASSWADWQERLENARKKLEASHKVLESPRGR